MVQMDSQRIKLTFISKFASVKISHFILLLLKQNEFSDLFG
jgi:uncharacterized membrane protein (DUF441 family)